MSRPTLSKIADFLLFLWEKRHLSPSAIKGYHSMLSSVFRFKLPDLSSSPVIKDLLRSFEISRPRGGVVPPSWDLDKVLGFLRGPPFEPLSEASLRDLSKKTLFLVALATAKRISELQALSSRVVKSGDGLILSFLPEFLAKTESSSNPLPRFFTLKSLDDFVGDLPDERLLCSVRALEEYLNRTKSLRFRPRSLFVSPRSPSRSLSKNALSYFIRETISSAGALDGDEGRLPRAHNVRAVSTFIAFMRN